MLQFKQIADYLCQNRTKYSGLKYGKLPSTTWIEQHIVSTSRYRNRGLQRAKKLQHSLTGLLLRNLQPVTSVVNLFCSDCSGLNQQHITAGKNHSSAHENWELIPTAKRAVPHLLYELHKFSRMNTLQKMTPIKFTAVSSVLNVNNKNLGQLQALGQDDKDF